ncbi:hypothetical protein C479_13658 [Halovivax asiaticus JCM 14624]|uniref:Uncharacterized protein n=2 Tax=Halovivax asiaticus TaxID=332953 RepID=M0BFF1_9EURY|nr:hypothetical protein C479_13658 [Halovivax asiaticus JCM 14624]
MGAAFAAPAAADSPDDVNLNGNSFWEGEEVTFNAIEGSSLSGDKVIVTADNGDGSVVKELPVNNGNATLDTGAIGTGTFEVADGSNTTSITVSDQDLTLEPEFDSVSQGDSLEISVDSARTGYNLTLTADGLSTSDLANALGAEASDEDDYVLIQDVSSTDSITIDSSSLNQEEYNVSAGVEDTDAEDSFSFEVTEQSDTNIEFGNDGTATGVLGDHNTITVNTDDASSVNLSVTWTPDNEEITIFNGTVTANSNSDQVKIPVNTHELLKGATQDELIGEESGGSFALDYAMNASADYDSSPAEVWSMTSSFDMELTQGGSNEDRGLFRVTDRSTESLSTYAISQDAYDEISGGNNIAAVAEHGTATDGTIAEGDVLVTVVEGTGFFGYAENLSENGVELGITHTNPGFGGDEVTLDQLNNGLVTNESAGQMAAFYQIPEDNESNEFNVTFDVYSEDDVDEGEAFNPYTDTTESFSESFTVEEPTLSFDSDKYEVAPEEGQEITGTTNIAPGNEIRVEAGAYGDNGFVEDGTGVVQDDGSWAAAIDFSGEVQDTEFDLEATNRAYDDYADDGKLVDEAEGVIGEDVGATPSLSISTDVPSEVAVDEDATLTVTVENKADSGTAAGNISITVDGEEVTSEELELEAGGSQEFTADFDTSSAGDIEYSVTTTGDDGDQDDSTSGTLTVAEEDPGTGDESEGSGDDDEGDDEGGDSDDGEGSPGFGVAVALVALLSAAMLALRRQD